MKETITNYVGDLTKMLGEGAITERRTFIRSFVRDIRVTGNE